MQVAEGHDLEVAKADIRNCYYKCDAPRSLRRFFGLRPVKASHLRRAGVAVPSSQVDARGYTPPRLTIVPMGWAPAPGVTQGAHENLLYGSRGEGSEKARAMPPVLDPAARWSSEQVPELDSAEASSPHALVVDDFVLFRQRKRKGRPRKDSRLADACRRYAEVGLEAHPEKVCEFATSQDILGYRLDRNVLRARNARFDQLRAWVRSFQRRGWAKPREVERLVGKFTHIFLLHRLSLSVFAAVYAFGQKVGHKRARLWPSVLRELRTAVALVLVVRSDLTRPVADVLVQTDASEKAPASCTRARCRTGSCGASACARALNRVTQRILGRSDARGRRTSRRHSIPERGR